MSRKTVKADKETVRSRLQIQITKGAKLVELSKPLIDSRDQSYDHSLEIDSYILKYKHWHSFTRQTLIDLFTSVSYADEFEKYQSEHVRVNPHYLAPEIDHLVRARLIPKLDYLGVLLDDLDEFELAPPTPQPKLVQTNVSRETVAAAQPGQSLAVEKLTVPQLIKSLPIPQLAGVIIFVCGLMTGSFYLGKNFHSWTLERENSQLTTDAVIIRTERNRAVAERDSLEKIVQMIRRK